MKKLILYFLTIVTININAQSTLFNVYDYPNGFLNGNDKILPKLYGNSLFYAYNDPSLQPTNYGPCLQKNNLDGVPVWKKVYTGLDVVNAIHAYNGNIIICGVNAIGTGTNAVPHVYIAAIDTSNGNVIYFQEHSIQGYNHGSITTSKLTSNGELIVAGQLTLPLAACCNGYIAKFDAANGNLIYQNRLIVNGQDLVFIRAIEENSSGSFFITGGYSNVSSNNFIAKAMNNSLLSMATIKSINGQPTSIDKISGNKILIHSGGGALKLDTNLNLLPNMISWSSNMFGGTNSKYYNGKWYTMGNSPKRIAVIDTLGNMLNVSNSYTYSGQANTGFSIAFFEANNSNLFITHDAGTSIQPWYLLKTDLTGNMSCAVSSTVATSSFSVSMANITYSVIPITSTLGVTSPTVLNGLISYTTHCLTATSINEIANSSTIKVLYSDNGSYTIENSNNIQEIVVYDLNGKVVYCKKSDNHSTKNNSFDLQSVLPGVYIVKVLETNGQQHQSKIVHFIR